MKNSIKTEILKIKNSPELTIIEKTNKILSILDYEIMMAEVRIAGMLEGGDDRLKELNNYESMKGERGKVTWALTRMLDEIKETY